MPKKMAIRRPVRKRTKDWDNDGDEDLVDKVKDAIDKFHKTAKWATQGGDKFTASVKSNAKTKWHQATKPFRDLQAGIKQDFANAKLRGQKTPLTQYPPSLRGGGGSGGGQGGKATTPKKPSKAVAGVVKNLKKIR